MEITHYEAEKSGESYVLRVCFDGIITSEWKQAYCDAVEQTPHINFRSSGAPTVEQMNFYDNYAISDTFSEFAAHDIPEFINEFKKIVEVANLNFEKVQVEKQKEEERRKREQDEQDAKLKAINDLIHQKPGGKGR